MHSRGGIGNQLFVLGAGLARADELGCPLYVDPSQHRYTPALPYLLDVFLGAAPSALSDSVVSLSEPTSALARATLRRGIPARCTYVEPSFAFDPGFFEVQPGTCVLGYLQSWRYLDRITSERRLQLLSAIQTLGKFDAVWKPNDVVLHVRRGDYLKPGVTEIHGVLGFDYYSAAVDHLRNLGFDGQIWLVAEQEIADVGELEATLSSPVRQVTGTSIWHDLALLASAPSLVIANSTFSWMGGWLGSVGRPIIAPRPWFRAEGFDTSDLIPQSWYEQVHEFGGR